VRVVAVAQGAPCDAPPVGRSIQAGQSWSVRDLDLLTSYTFHAIASDGLHETCSTLGVDAATSTSPLHFVISGDTQTLSTSDQKLALWMGQYQNLCEQTPRIQHVIHTGDVINLGDDPGNSQIPVQYARAAQAFDVLDACGIGYSIPAGNHDYVYAPPSEIDDQDYLDFINGRPPSHWRDVVVGANTPFYIKRLFDRYYLVVLRFRYADSDDAAIEAYVQANPDKRFMVVHHSGAKRVDAPVDFDLLAGLIDRNPNIIGMISGHWLGWPRTGYGTNTSLPRTDWLRVYSNFQDSEPGYPWPAFAQWMTRMTYYPATREFCFRSEDPIAGSFDIAGPEFCWYDPT
jgi:hypothetical protein